MRIPVLVEPCEGGGFVARNGELRVTAEGDSEEQAIQHFRLALRAMLDAYGPGCLDPLKRIHLIDWD